MSMIRVSSPTRVDLAGGTLDLWPLYNFLGGAQTLNLAIDIRTHAEILPTAGEVILESADLQETKRYPNISAALADTDPKFLLLRVVLREIAPDRGFHLKTKSESPVGGGLGGSSSLMVSMLKAFCLFLGRPLPEPHALAHWAHNVEAEILNTPTGKQDYYPAISGGMNLLTFGTKGVEQEVFPLTGSPFESKFLLVYTGRSHHSGLNNFEVLKSAVAKDPRVMEALRNLKVVSSEMVSALRERQWDLLAGLFRREYQARVQLSPAFTCPEIEELDRVSKAAGAEAIKICGAGGGGCVMLWCPEGRRETIAEACEKAGFKTLNARPVQPLSPLSANGSVS